LEKQPPTKQFNGGDDDDDDDDDDDEEEGQVKRDITGIELKNDKLFFAKMKAREPTLFLTQKQGKYKSYSRTCPSNVSKQPIILTQEEKDKIDKEHPGSYNKALKYGTDPNNPHYFICPRYWCLLDNTSMTKEEVDAGVCGGKIIPKDEPTPPPGHNIVEFTDDRYHMKNGNYVEHYPGFLDTSKHPDGKCIPCCFSRWKSESQRKRRAKCGLDEEGMPISGDTAETSSDSISSKPEIAETKTQFTSYNAYIVGAEKLPMPQYRWGFLPISVELFLHTDNSKAVTKQNPSLIRKNAPCLLRYGVEQTQHQSFVGCIADIYAYVKKLDDVPKIKEMRNIISVAVTLDLFLRYHNGSLVAIFQPKKPRIDQDIVSKYIETSFYKSIDTGNESQMGFLYHTISAYENFLAFLNDDDSLIDHTYLWDIVTSANSQLFVGGLNLVIMEITDDDNTNNIEILCPTNSYTTTFYDPRKETVLFVKRGSFYEPVYLYEDKQSIGKIVSKKTFLEHSSIRNVRDVLKMIQKTTNDKCKALPSMPRVYNFEQNISAVELLRKLKLVGYSIQGQVINYRGKIIGLMVSKTVESTSAIFVPCFPSAMMPDIEVQYMEDRIWTDYKKTRDGLREINALSKNEIKCAPRLKVMEDAFVVGFLTDTNQFVQIDPPVENREEDGIDVLESSNYIVADRVITTSTAHDNKRVETIKRISLETQFYIAFRNTVRILLHEPTNRTLRLTLMELLNESQLLYKSKLKKMEILLRDITTGAVIFQEIDAQLLSELGEISTCTSKCDSKKYCLLKDDNQCQLILPKLHLVSGADNEVMYVARLADELLRYSRIRLFMLEPKTYLSITNIDYRTSETEFIILESLLNSEYFDDLISSFQTNAYLQNVPYEIAAPVNSQIYSNEVTLNEQYSTTDVTTNLDELSIECIRETRDIIGNATSYWKRMFPATAREMIFYNSPHCSFYVLIYILQKYLNTPLSVVNVKETLIQAYIEKGGNKQRLYKELQKQGKRDMINRVIQSQTTLETLIMSEEYYLTNTDIVVFSEKLKLPIVLFSTMKLRNLDLDRNWKIIESGKPREKHYFIRVPVDTDIQNAVPSFHLITPALTFDEVKGMDQLLREAGEPTVPPAPPSLKVGM